MLRARVVPRLSDAIVEKANAEMHIVTLNHGEISVITAALEVFSEKMKADGTPLQGVDQEDRWLINGYRKLAHVAKPFRNMLIIEPPDVTEGES